jgi:hypothetical protein
MLCSFIALVNHTNQTIPYFYNTISCAKLYYITIHCTTHQNISIGVYANFLKFENFLLLLWRLQYYMLSPLLKPIYAKNKVRDILWNEVLRKCLNFPPAD